MKIENTLLDIEQASQLTGLPPATLRNWEKRYGFPIPERTTGGHRLYQLTSIRQLQEIVGLTNNGVKVKEAIERTLKGPAAPATSPLGDSMQTPFSSLNEGLLRILQMLYKFDLRGAEEQLSKMGMRLSEGDLLDLVYPKLLAQIGDDWENGRINVAQEHFSWHFFRLRLLNYFKTSRTNARRPKIILTTPEGELHEGGLMILGAHMNLKDWEVYYLGASLPLNDLKRAVENINPDLVCLSSVRDEMIRKSWDELQKMDRPIVIGGPCLTLLKATSMGTSENIFFIEGGSSVAIPQIELLLHANREL